MYTPSLLKIEYFVIGKLNVPLLGHVFDGGFKAIYVKNQGNII